MKNVLLLILDVDGTLTDGGLYFAESGESLKRFHAQDGLGIVLARYVDLKVAWITGRSSKIVEKRASDLGVSLLRMGVHDKAAAVRDVCELLGISPENTAFMGDDLNDLPGFGVVRVKMAPANAVPYVRERADWVSTRNGGDGAVREAIDAILEAHGDREHVVKLYLASLEAVGTSQ
jgi:3-deoxy-D-manno-octulosonate 8-phosphate phosphatase (KDO 8-P phosphatase)